MGSITDLNWPETKNALLKVIRPFLLRNEACAAWGTARKLQISHNTVLLPLQSSAIRCWVEDRRRWGSGTSLVEVRDKYRVKGFTSYCSNIPPVKTCARTSELELASNQKVTVNWKTGQSDYCPQLNWSPSKNVEKSKGPADSHSKLSETQYHTQPTDFKTAAITGQSRPNQYFIWRQSK